MLRQPMAAKMATNSVATTQATTATGTHLGPALASGVAITRDGDTQNGEVYTVSFAWTSARRMACAPGGEMCVGASDCMCNE